MNRAGQRRAVFYSGTKVTCVNLSCLNVEYAANGLTFPCATFCDFMNQGYGGRTTMVSGLPTEP